MVDADGGLNSHEDDGGGARTHRLPLSVPPSLAVPQVSQGEGRRDRDRHRRRRRYPAQRRLTRFASARRLLCGPRTCYQEVDAAGVDRLPLYRTTTTATATTTLPPPHISDPPSHTTDDIMHINEAQPRHALLALDALRYGEARAQVAFVPSGEDEDVYKLKITVPRSIRVHGVPRKVFKLDLTVLGQLCEDFHLETTAGGGVSTTTVRFTLCERQSPSALLLWEDARGAIEALPRLVDEPVHMDDLVWLDMHTGAMRLRMTGSKKHSQPEDARGFPLFDAEGDRIVLSDARQFPLGVAMHAVFQLRCERDAHGTLSMCAIVSSLSLV
ncbi:hypothetical protein EIP86_003000 [Pleurotus ostreatoroseus]|nr:hypothetical protein EIP86_003000 [Pleurotus ostreatoroseus]